MNAPQLLQRLLPSQDIDALLGDITEEARHRSRLWYWGQIAAVIVVRSFREVRRHPLVALRAIGVGILSLALISLMMALIVDRAVMPLVFAAWNNWFHSADFTRASKVVIAVAGGAATVVFYSGLTLSGWIVGRLHRRHGIAFVLLFAAFVQLSLYLLVTALWIFAPSRVTVQPATWRAYLRDLAIPVSIVIGGYWSTRVKPAMTPTRLLQRLLPSSDTDALLGDITEETRHQSWLQYWGQVCAPLVVGSWRDVRRHPLLALRAVGIGLLTLFVIFLPAPSLLRVGHTLSDWAYSIGPYWLALRPNGLTWLPSIVNPIGFAVSGWVVARTNRSHGVAMLLPWTMLVCVLPLITLNAVVTYHGPTRFAPAIGGIIANISLPVWVVAGGVLGVRRRKRNDSTESQRLVTTRSDS